ncbi:MAG TPA: LysR family transcriptional regulator, partial [Naasia sp.]
VTPSRVSQAIRQLEVRVGGALFDRTSRRVALTPLGEHLQAGLGPAYRQLEEAFARTRAMAADVTGSLAVGMALRTSGGPRFLEIVKAFERKHPACAVNVVDIGFAQDPREWMRTRAVDLVATRLPLDDPELVQGPVLSREPRVALVSVDHPLAGREEVELDELGGYHVAYNPRLPAELTDALVPRSTPSGRALPRMEVWSIEEAMFAVALGKLVHLTVPSFLEAYPHPGVVGVPIADMPLSETALVWLKGHETAKHVALAAVAAEDAAVRLGG